MHDGVTKSIFAHLTPAKGMDFPGCREGCENDYQRFGQFGRRVVFRCDNEPSILALLRAVKLAWQCGSTRNVCRGRPAVQRRCRKFGKNVIKGMSDRSSLAVESASSVEVPADHDLSIGRRRAMRLVEIGRRHTK